jgi:hypothetical protein
MQDNPEFLNILGHIFKNENHVPFGQMDCVQCGIHLRVSSFETLHEFNTGQRPWPDGRPGYYDVRYELTCEEQQIKNLLE